MRAGEIVSVKVTFKEISEICGVSLGTVDRAINNRPGIHPETRARILEVAKQLGYRPHLLARSLATGSTMTIGVVVPNLTNSFFSELAEVIQKGARRAGYYVYLMLSEYDSVEEMESLERLRSLNVDGIIMTSVNRGRSFDAYLTSLATPVVSVSNRISKRRAWVGIDDYSATRDAMRFVLSKGYERIIFVTENRGPGKVSNLYCDERRIRGYKDALQASALDAPPTVVSDDAMLAMLDSGGALDGKRTCIACSCDEVALNILNALRTRGIAVPAEVGLTGFDNLDQLEYVVPRLTTVAYPMERIGEEAFKSVLDEINGRAGGSRTLEHLIVEGETV